MKKLIKWIVGLGTVGTAIGLLAVRLIKKSKSTSSDIKADSTDSNKEETDSDTFDLDQDLEPTQERSYVSLQAARPDDLTEKSDVKQKHNQQFLMNQMIRLLKTNNKKESGWFNLTLNKIELSRFLFI